ncbi:MAG TPA: hypothetical protein VMC09_14255 [Anaerolineales bacterium]|nr:hypothetical protein [Anaerolineales bacterium]
MSTHKSVEPHGCIVCGRIHDLLIVRSDDGRLVDCSVTSPGGRQVTDPERILVACDRHSSEEIERAIARHYPGRAAPDKPDED